MLPVDRAQAVPVAVTAAPSDDIKASRKATGKAGHSTDARCLQPAAEHSAATSSRHRGSSASTTSSSACSTAKQHSKIAQLRWQHVLRHQLLISLALGRHSSQGSRVPLLNRLSSGRVVLDVGLHLFAYGQPYVALNRFGSMEGLVSVG